MTSTQSSNRGARMARGFLHVSGVLIIAAVWTLILELVVRTLPVSQLDAISLAAVWGLEVVLVGFVVLLAMVSWVAWGLLRRFGRWRALASPWIPGVLAAVFAIPLLVMGGKAMASGDWISRQWFAPAVHWSLVVPTLVVAPILSWSAIPNPSVLRPSMRRALTALLLVGSLVATLADAHVQPGLHAPFHIYASVVAAALAATAIHRLLLGSTFLRGLSGPRRFVGALALAALAGGGLAAWFGMSQGTKSKVLGVGPYTGHFLSITSQPSGAPIREILASLDVKVPGEFDVPEDWPRGTIDGQQWNVVLVMVDTLRGDALPPMRPPEGTRFAKPGDTPFLDEWLEGSYRFSRAYAPATMTYKSVPATFHSAQWFEDAENLGDSLTDRLAASGRTPLAVVHTWFHGDRLAKRMDPLRSFDKVEVYSDETTNEIAERAGRLVAAQQGRPFYLWVHLFSVHDPGYAGRRLKGSDGNRVERYRKSLQWTDQEIGRLMGELQEAGVYDRTLVILLSDHGESLGDGGYALHGYTVQEEEVRVPLAFRLPGEPGAVIDQVVGLVDVTPTVMDLLGGPASPHDRGVSLVPFFTKPDRTWSRSYYFENHWRTQVGMVEGNDKLIVRREHDLIARYDLAVDPTEDENIYDPADPRSRELLMTLLRHDPAVATDVELTEVRRLLLQRLREVGPETSPATLEFLLGLTRVAVRPDILRKAKFDLKRPMMIEAERIFDEATDDRVRMAVLFELFDRAPTRFSRVLRERIGELEGTEQQLDFIRDLAGNGQPSFAPQFLAQSMMSWVDRDNPELWGPWLALLGNWQHVHESFSTPLRAMLDRIHRGDPVDNSKVSSVLRPVAHLRVKRLDSAELDALQKGVRPLLDHADPVVVVAATEAAAALGDRAVVDQLERRARGEPGLDLRVRKASLEGAVTILGVEAIPLVQEVGEDEQMVFVAIHLLGGTGSPEAIPYLRSLVKTRRGYIRRDARDAIKNIHGKDTAHRKAYMNRKR